MKEITSFMSLVKNFYKYEKKPINDVFSSFFRIWVSFFVFFSTQRLCEAESKHGEKLAEVEAMGFCTLDAWIQGEGFTAAAASFLFAPYNDAVSVTTASLGGICNKIIDIEAVPLEGRVK